MLGRGRPVSCSPPGRHSPCSGSDTGGHRHRTSHRSGPHPRRGTPPCRPPCTGRAGRGASPGGPLPSSASSRPPERHELRITSLLSLKIVSPFVACLIGNVNFLLHDQLEKYCSRHIPSA